MLAGPSVPVCMGHKLTRNNQAIYPQLADNLRAITGTGHPVYGFPRLRASQQGANYTPLAGGVYSGKLCAVEGAQFCFYRGLGVFHFTPPARNANPPQATQGGHLYGGV